MKIVKYSDEMKGQLIEMILQIQQQEFNIPITLDEQPDLQNINKSYSDLGGNFWVCVHEGSVIGSIGLLKIADRQYALRKMFVKNGFRGSQYSVAANLLQCAETWVREVAGTNIYLGTTDQFLAAHKFYRKNGYLEVSRHDLPNAFPIMAVDTLFFTKVLMGSSLP